jgi:hypothetical protein
MKYNRSKMRAFVQTMNAAEALLISETCAEFSRLAEAFFPVALTRGPKHWNFSSLCVTGHAKSKPLKKREWKAINAKRTTSDESTGSD